MLDPGGIALLKHEYRQSEPPEIVREGNYFVLFLLEGVTNKNQSRDLEQFGLALGVGEDLADLRVPGAAVDPGHEAGEVIGVRDPFRAAALGVVPIIDQLHAEPADAGDGAEHVALELASRVPGLLPAHGGVEGADQPSRGGRLTYFQVSEKRIDLEFLTRGWSLLSHVVSFSGVGGVVWRRSRNLSHLISWLGLVGFCLSLASTFENLSPLVGWGFGVFLLFLH